MTREKFDELIESGKTEFYGPTGKKVTVTGIDGELINCRDEEGITSIHHFTELTEEKLG